jgi:hypothetical protein
MRKHIQKANSAFIQFYIIWEAKEISTARKLGIFKTSAKSVLLYGKAGLDEMEQ